MIIIFDGPKQSGKTYYTAKTADKLREVGWYNSVEVVSNNVGAESKLKYPLKYVETPAFYRKKSDLVIDGWHWSDQHSAVDGRVSPEFKWVELKLASLGAISFRLDASSITLQKRDIGAIAATSNFKSYDQQIKHYEFMEANSINAGTTQNTELATPNLDNIIAQASYMDSDTAPLEEFPTYMGRSVPHTLIVVESANPSVRLIDSIPDDWWKGAGFIGLGGKEDVNLAKLVDALYGPPIIAAGPVVRDYLKWNKFDFEYVEDPKNLVTMNDQEVKEYGRTIQRAVATPISFS